MTSQIIEIESALTDYCDAVASISESEYMADYQRLISITEQIIKNLKTGDVQEVNLLTLAFSRCVTDSFATQPYEYQHLSRVVHEVK